MPTEMDGVLLALVRAGDAAAVAAAFDELEASCRRLDLDGAMAIIRRLVPEYSGAAGIPAEA